MARISIPKFGSQRVFLAQLEQDSINEKELDFHAEFTLIRSAQEIEVLIPTRSQPDHQGNDSLPNDTPFKQKWCKLVIGNHKKRAELRRELSQLADHNNVVGTQESLVLFRLTARESLSVELKIIRLAREVDLELERLEIMMPISCFADAEDGDAHRSAHLKSLCHTLPGRSGFYVFASDVFGGLEHGRLQDIGLFSNPKRNPNYNLIKCQIAEDHSHLNALSANIDRNAAVTMLIKVNQKSQVVAFSSEDDISTMPGRLIRLEPPKSLLLESWLMYRELEQDLENKRLAEREQFIEYHNLNSRGIKWTARVRTRSEVLKSWFPRTGKDPTFKLEPPQMVVLMKRGDQSEKAKRKSPKAELIEVRNYQPNEGRATFVFKARKHSSKPEIAGEVHAIADHGDSTQRQRRADANKRLMSRNIANPQMIEWLMSPEMARPPANRTLRYPFNRNLNEDQQRAVECALTSEDVFLIQGPPGTGKTSVIVEIIKQLVQRGRPDSDMTGPVRILVSSIQNDAIRHATDKITGGNNDYDIHVFQQLSDYEQQIKDMYTDASQISSLIAQRCLKSDEVWEYETYRFAQKSAMRLTNVLAEHIEVINQGEIPISQAMLAVEVLESRMIERFSESEASMYYQLKSKNHTQTSQSYFEEELSRLVSQLALALSVTVEKLAKIAEEEEETQTHTRHGEDSEGNDTQAVPVILPDQPQREVLEKYKADIIQLIETGGIQDNLSMLINITLKGLLKAFNRGREEKIAKNWEILKELLTQAQGELSFDENAHKRSPDELRSDEISRLYNRVNMLIQQHHESFELRCAELAERSHLFALRQFAEELKMFPNQWVKLLERYAPVSAATCQRSAKFAETSIDYDYVIIDEAGRVTPYDLLIPAIQGRHLILIGDQRQLPPTVEDSIERKMLNQSGGTDVMKISDRSLFEELFDRLNASNKVMLRTQYRMNAKIGALVSEVFYDRRLKSYFKPNDPEKTPQMGLFNDDPLVWINVAPQCGHTSFKYENYHETEAVFDIILSLREQLTSSDTEEKRVGIVTAYGDQKRAIQRRLKELRLDSYFDIGTIDSFQGKEFELVILSTSTHNSKGNIGFMKLPNRINVALSRAQRQLLILGSSTTHRKAGYWLNDCLEYIHREGLVVDSLHLSQYLPSSSLGET